MEDSDILTISKRSAQGIFALISRSFLLNALSYIASLIIFTYLSPKEFGIYIAVLAIQRIISFFTDFGFGAALIQKKEKLNQSDLKTSFTIQAAITFLAFIIVVLGRNLIASYFQLSSSAMLLLITLVFTIFLSSFKVIPSILLEREIKFHKLVVPQIIESFVYNLLLIFLVLGNNGINSYTWAFLVSSLIGIPFYYKISPWKIEFGIDINSLKHLKYGIQFQSKNILATLKDDFLTIFLAKILSFNDLGYIGFGQRNAFFIYRYVVDSVTKVTFSTYSRIQENTELLKKGIEKSLFFVSASVFPILFGLIVSAPYLVHYFPKWQNKWEPAVISLIFFCLNAMVSSLSGILVNVLDATGRVGTTLKLMVLWTVLTWGLTVILIYVYGYNGVSMASFLVTLTIVFTIYLTKKVVNFEFFKSIYKPFICSLIMGIVVYMGGQLFIKNFLTLILIIILGGIVYFISLYILVGQALTKDLKKMFIKT